MSSLVNQTSLCASNMDFKWSNEQVFLLLQMFEEREILWNTKLDGYRDRNKKHEAWMEIAKTFEIEKSVIEKKMRSLIAQFQRELKKDKLGNGAGEISSWFAFKKMMFLKDRKPARESNVKMKGDNNDNEKEKDTDENEQNVFAPPKNNTYRKRAKPQEDKMPEEALSILSYDKRESRQTRDEFDVFGEYVAMKLRHLNSSHAKHTAQYHINNILYNAAIGEYDWPSLNSPSRNHGTANNLGGYDCNTPGPSSLSQSSIDETKQSLDDRLLDIQQSPSRE